MTTTNPHLVIHRDSANQVAIVFIHGFSGKPQRTFPNLLASDKRISGWDIFSLKYASRLMLDLVGLWSADPPLISLADLLRTAAANSPLDRYRSLAFVAHSMGGLIVQRALVDDERFMERVSHVFLFGTPSAGLVKASLFSRLKRQFRDMGENSTFIIDLRNRWSHQFGAMPPFRFLSIAGDQDEFVPRTSSIDPFPRTQRAVIPGNHLQIVDPLNMEDLSIQLVLKGLVGDAAPAGPWNSARVAVESREFQGAVRHLELHKQELDDAALVQLALALEGVGRQEDAMKVLEEQGRSNMDAMGVLAGRLKRRWLLERRQTDAQRVQELYAEAFALAEAANDSKQAFYHGINIAFMNLAYGDDRSAAKTMARKVLAHCQRALREKWRLATEGEAYLILGETDVAIARYREAVCTQPTPTSRELDSMYQQAVLVVGLVGDKSTADQLDAIFRRGDQ